jgi:hypothetical protein
MKGFLLFEFLMPPFGGGDQASQAGSSWGEPLVSASQGPQRVARKGNQFLLSPHLFYPKALGLA